MDHVECLDRDGLSCWLGNLDRERHGDDHSDVGISNCNRSGDGESGSFIGYPVTDNSEFRFIRGYGNLHRYREGLERQYDGGCHRDVGIIRHGSRDRLVGWVGDLSHQRHSDDHGDIGIR